MTPISIYNVGFSILCVVGVLVNSKRNLWTSGMGAIEKADTRSLQQDEAVPVQTGQNAAEVVEPGTPVPNGGLQAWLSVLAGFCVFVNSW
jgi:hypothetical protein